MIGFRVDANEIIATGHLMRCMAIALELKRREMDCLFLLAEDKATDHLRVAKLPYRVLNSNWHCLMEELPKLKQVIKDEELNWLVVDSYQASSDYLETLNRLVPVLYVDDILAEPYEVSALLHYEDWLETDWHRKWYEKTDTKLLLGMEYVPLRAEFYSSQKVLENRILEHAKDGEISILVTTGGTDPFHIERRLIETWLRQKREWESKSKVSLKFHLIVGAMVAEIESLDCLVQDYEFVHLHQNVPDMGDRMRSCDLAVSAGGSTLFELCACGVPTVCFSFADNQVELAMQVQERHIMLYAGDARTQEAICEEILTMLFSYVEDIEMARQYSANMRKLVDGKGTARIADFLMDL